MRAVVSVTTLNIVHVKIYSCQYSDHQQPRVSLAMVRPSADWYFLGNSETVGSRGGLGDLTGAGDWGKVWLAVGGAGVSTDF